MAEKLKSKRQLAAEIKELNQELKNYDERNAAMEDNIAATERKKTRVLNVLNSNRARYTSVVKDSKKILREAKKANKAMQKMEAKNIAAKENVIKQKKEMSNLRTSITEQIESVVANIDSLNSSSSSWQQERLQLFEKCQSAKAVALQSLSRFINISAPAQIWLSHEVDEMKSISAVADLQGLVGEWSSLRAIAAEIQSIGDTAATDANGKPVYNPGLIHTLKENRDKAIVGLVKEEASLRVDISTLEKERRHMHSLLLDLVYYIEQDSRHNASVINNVATSNMKTALPDALSANNNSVETVVPPIPPKSALKKVTKNLGDCTIDNGVSKQQVKKEKTVTYDIDKEKGAVVFDSSSLDSDVENRTVTKDSSDTGHLTDNWLQKLDITNDSPFVNALRRYIGGETGSSKEVNFKTAIEALNKKMEIENLRLGVAAQETKIVWRHLQKTINEFSSQICRNARSDWDNRSQDLSRVNQASEEFHYGNCYFEQSETLKPGPGSFHSVEINDKGPLSESNCLSTLKWGLDFCDRWHSYRQRLTHAGMATQSVCPSSPLYMLNRTLNVVKKPKQRKNKTTHQNQQQGLMQMLKDRVEDIQQAKKAVEQKKEEFQSQSVTHEHLTDADRKARKRERTIRIKMFQQKLVAKRITQASSFALMSEQLMRRLSNKSRPSTGSRSAPKTADRISRSTTAIREGRYEDEDEDEEESDADSEFDEEDRLFGDDSADGRNQLMSDIADKGITTSSNSHHTVPLLGENSFIESGLNVQFEPKDELNQADAAKLYADLLEKVNKELSDQIVTQLTLKMGPESVSIVVYWQPFDDRLKIKVFCFNRNEEYTCYVDQVVVQDLFSHSEMSINSAKIQSMFVIRNLIERMTIESIPRSQALEMTLALKSSYPTTDIPETPDPRESKLKRRGKGSSKAKDVEPSPEKKESGFNALLRSNFVESNFLAKNLNNEEEEKVHVLTIRSLDTKEVLVCSIAKIKTTDWEELLSALPLAHGGTEGKQDDEVKEDIPNTSKNLTDVKSFRGRSTQFTS